jgi:hypothetical protein
MKNKCAPQAATRNPNASKELISSFTFTKYLTFEVEVVEI